MPWLSVNEALIGSFPTSVESVITTAIADQSAQRRKGDMAARSRCAPPLIYLTCSIAFMVGWNVQM